MPESTPVHVRNYSAATEDYLKAIYVLHQEHGQVTTSLLSEHLGVAPPSITGMFHKLAKLALVIYRPYQGVTLTHRGECTALNVLRRHRLLKLFLMQALGYGREEAHAEADVLEHVISERLETRIAAYLGHPAVDPHGDPIPAADSARPTSRCRLLARLAIGAIGWIAHTTHQHPEIMYAP